MTWTKHGVLCSYTSYCTVALEKIIIIMNLSVHFCVDDPIVTDCVSGDIQLIGGPTPFEGTVEVCRNSVWGGVCQYHWTFDEANTVCSQLGFQSRGTCVRGQSVIHLCCLMSLFSGAAAVRDSLYGRASGFLYMTNVGEKTHSHSEDAMWRWKSCWSQMPWYI